MPGLVSALEGCGPQVLLAYSGLVHAHLLVERREYSAAVSVCGAVLKSLRGRSNGRRDELEARLQAEALIARGRAHSGAGNPSDAVASYDRALLLLEWLRRRRQGADEEAVGKVLDLRAEAAAQTARSGRPDSARPDPLGPMASG